MQVYTCDQVLSYLRQFVVVEKAAVEEKKAVDAPAPGMKLLNKKTLDAEADALWGSVQAKKGKGARKAAEKQKAAEAVKVGEGSGWQHWVVVVTAVLGWVGHLWRLGSWASPFTACSRVVSQHSVVAATTWTAPLQQ